MTALPIGNEYYTYADYCTWEDDTRWELIEGVPYAMAPPGPSELHQDISIRIIWQLREFLKGKPCKLFHAPFDVRLDADGEDDTVVQPDLLVVCDRSKLDGKSCVGAPDLIIEILSPSSVQHDRWRKYNLYQRAGVREYWVAAPDTKTVDVHLLKNGEYSGKTYGGGEAVPVGVLPGCLIRLDEVFEEAASEA